MGGLVWVGEGKWDRYSRFALLTVAARQLATHPLNIDRGRSVFSHVKERLIDDMANRSLYTLLLKLALDE